MKTFLNFQRCLDEFIKEARERIDFKAVLREQNLKAAGMYLVCTF